MRRPFALLSVLLLALTVTPAFGDIAAIHANALPQEPSILAALDDARQLEPYVSLWTNDWKHPIAKDEVAKRLEKDLDFLGAALQKHPDNAELALLTGLVAHYAYNVDVADSHDKAVFAFEAAQKLTPTDMRTTWFHADLLCQTKETEAGSEIPRPRIHAPLGPVALSLLGRLHVLRYGDQHASSCSARRLLPRETSRAEFADADIPNRQR